MSDPQLYLLLARIAELTAEKEAAEAEVERLTAELADLRRRLIGHEGMGCVFSSIDYKARAEAAEAAIQRVREVVNPDAPMVPTRTVLRALGGGESDE